jgi:hypothetical protein
MDRKYIDDHHIVARYLADQLPDGEREAFESYYLEHPDVVKEMEVVARLKAGLLQLEASGDLEQLTHPRARSSRWSFLAAAAAAAAIAFGLLFFLDRDARPAPLVAASLAELQPNVRTLGGASPYQLIRMRRAGRVDAEIDLPIRPTAIQLQILPEYENPSNRYRVVLRRIENDEPREIGTATTMASSDGFVHVFLDSEGIPAGLYEIELGQPLPVSDSSVFTIRIVEAKQ